MKKVRASRRKSTEEPDWLSEVILESARDPRLSRKTPRRNRVWILIVRHRIPGMGLALILKRRAPLGSRIATRLNPNVIFQSLLDPKVLPLCGFYDDFDDSISLKNLHDQLRWIVIRKFEHFLKTDLGKKIQEKSTLSDSLTLLIRKIQAL